MAAMVDGVSANTQYTAEFTLIVVTPCVPIDQEVCLLEAVRLDASLCVWEG